MATEEIEKAAQVESDKLVLYCSKDDFKRGFIKGFELSDKHWQEKTRWKSLLDEPPKLPTSIDKERLILIKHAKGGYDTKFLVKQSSIDMFLRDGFVAWKEIE